ncbi:MAG TPA: aminoglycoside 6'-N-acetyltransferase [Thermoanaerobaculia bacterium]|nr:aminoglycoside 6'-N-acetyltransferase [Thermoanaerobaculia bacterium]
MRIRLVQRHDADAWERMREALWPAALGEHAREIAAFFDGARDDPAEVFVADEEGALLGFAEVSIRSHAEGCEPGTIAYLEGWWVEPEARRRGVGGELIAGVCEWARGRGCSALASDAELENAASHAAHQALGFEEAGRIVCFRKRL